MRLRPIITGLALVLTVSACGGHMPFSRLKIPEAKFAATAPVHIAAYHVTVPRTLRTTEAEVWYPDVDILWKGDPAGDRYAQVAALFEQGIVNSASFLGEGRPVDVNIEVSRFHGITDRARYTVGGWQEMTFTLEALDAATGAVVIPRHEVDTAFKSQAARRATEADGGAASQKLQVTSFLTRLIYHELTGMDLPAQGVGTVAEPVPVETGGQL